ncbi:MAG: EF-hand domain-containing protein [Chthoniobacterales bacterium]
MQTQNISFIVDRNWLAAFCLLAVIVLCGCANNSGESSARSDRFARADANHDGVLDRNEVSDFIVSEIFDSRDANHDGRMTEQEWTAGDPGRLPAFKKRDTNKDGIVTKEEAVNYARTHGSVDELMRDADTNHDGVLSRAEAQAYSESKVGPAR